MKTKDINKLLDEISEWPWHWDGLSYVWRKDQQGVICDEVCRIRGYGSKEPQEINAQFIAAAPEIVSQLVKEKEQLRKALAGIKSHEIPAESPWQIVAKKALEETE